MKVDIILVMYKIYIEEDTTSELLLAHALKDYANIDQYDIDYNKYGKPYLKNINNIYFNISNTSNINVCVVSDQEIGVDIESPKYVSGIFNLVFTNKEKELVRMSNNKELDFIKIWTMKESYVKLLGIGISFGLKNVDTTKLTDKIDFKFYKNYVIAIATEK